MVAAAGASAAMLHHSVVSSRTVARLRATGVPVFAWTVDDPATLARVVAAGVAGVVSNDPGLLRDGRDTRDPTG
jgi:glycerophosphoryl diester phosphodiesterase